jgi:hypothetical protein
VHLAVDLRDERGNLAQHIGRQRDVEIDPRTGSAGLSRHDGGKVRRPPGKEIRRGEQQAAPFARPDRSPSRKCGRGRFRSHFCILHGCRGSTRHCRSGERIPALEDCSIRCRNMVVVDEKECFHFLYLPCEETAAGRKGRCREKASVRTPACRPGSVEITINVTGTSLNLVAPE